ncbi:MAG: hypothetical protein ACI9VM_000158 [Candidatus Azotimanducaceae bacterium]|jgi:hypothetical protein
MAPLQTRKIVPIRTFADDVKRARGTTSDPSKNDPAPTPPKPTTLKTELETTIEQISEQKRKVVPPVPPPMPPTKEVPPVEQKPEKKAEESIEIPPFHFIRASSPDETAYTDEKSISRQEKLKKTKDNGAFLKVPKKIDSPVPQIDIDQELITEHKESILSVRDGVFDIEEAVTAEVAEGNIVTDRKREPFRLFPAIFTALQGWFGTKKEEIAEAQKPKHTVAKSENRKETIQAAAEQTKQAPKDDYTSVADTLKKVERNINTEEFKIKEATDVQQPTWQHVQEDVNVEEEEKTEAQGSLDDALNDTRTPNTTAISQDIAEILDEPVEPKETKGVVDKNIPEEKVEVTHIPPAFTPEIVEKKPAIQNDSIQELEEIVPKPIIEPSKEVAKINEVPPVSKIETTKTIERVTPTVREVPEQPKKITPIPEVVIETAPPPKPITPKEEAVAKKEVEESLEENLQSQLSAALEKSDESFVPPPQEALVQPEPPQVTPEPAPGVVAPEKIETEVVAPKFNRTPIPDLALQKVGTPKETPQRGLPIRTLIIVSVVAIILGVGASAWYFIQNAPEETIIAPKTIVNTIATESSKEILFTNNRTELIAAIQEAIASQTTGAIEIHPTIEGVKIEPDQILAILIPNLPGSLARAVTQVTLGGFNGGEPFIVMKFTSFDVVFGEMLQAEETFYSDLAPLYGEAAQTTSLDARISNMDVRVLIADDTEDRVVYGFIDKNTILITTSREVYSSVSSLVK